MDGSPTGGDSTVIIIVVVAVVLVLLAAIIGAVVYFRSKRAFSCCSPARALTSFCGAGLSSTDRVAELYHSEKITPSGTLDSSGSFDQSMATYSSQGYASGGSASNMYDGVYEGGASSRNVDTPAF